jgi:hypothetical protein
MVLVMSRPWKHPKTGVYYFRKAVPDALRAALGRAEKKQSLQTKDPAEARLRFSVVAAEVEREWALLRAAPEDLTREQLHALAGRWYDWFVRLHADEVGANPDVWALPVDALRDLDTWGMDARDVSDDAERPSGVQRRIAAYLMDRGRVSDFLKHENLKLSERSLVGFLDIVEPEFSAAHYRLSRFAGVPRVASLVTPLTRHLGPRGSPNGSGAGEPHRAAGGMVARSAGDRIVAENPRLLSQRGPEVRCVSRA